MALTDDKVKKLEERANKIRISIIDILEDAGSGHVAGPLDMADIFTVLFFHTLRHEPKKPDWPERDRLVLSNGHICPVLYTTMAYSGYFPIEELRTLRQFGSRLQGHPHRDFLPMLETSSGPLGAGLSQAVGMALADKINHGLTSQRRIYALLSDGELESGATWEAAMLAGKEKLNNLVAVVDRNNIQIDGYVEDIMPLEPLSDKWRAWNWHVIEIDGHNMEEIADAFDAAKSIFEKPTVIIAHTIAGKGVKEFERDYRWHSQLVDKKTEKMALKELRTLGGKLDVKDAL
ncbi:MAG: transketolase [Candidatus Zambryskibacteria bacterium RIFCSPHIGHO2_01_FULL_44_22b]|uniref:Transketolase n=1 Tax=Candidatus Zambryskibacteria bacterium RIFCSPHIGHO2_01_FULL_44_22b TaxID=1802737 RepID=A0A1G2T121_9BACT|nr:MAG: transketolase [Candidatus Zambryskibacteria bacterium RIFCSPHIGHO2_01_FULL_44_22b]